MDIVNLDHTLVSTMMEDTGETGSKRSSDQISGGTNYDSAKRSRGESGSLVEGDGSEGFRTQPWPHEEDDRLLQAAATFKLPDNTVDWAQVSNHLGNRADKQCQLRYNTLMKHHGASRMGGWSAEEDARLTAAVRRNERKGGGIFWTKVCEEMGGERTHTQCLKRWRQTLQHIGSGARIGAWSEAEDNLLLEAMSLYEGQGKGGGIDWNKVSTHLGGVRAPTQCYKRWHDAIKQRRKHFLKGAQWGDEEMAKLDEAVQLFAGDGLGGGVEWNDVAAHVGTRNAKECCSQWNRVSRTCSKDFNVAGHSRIRTDPWDEMEERALFMGVEACREPAVDNHGDTGELVNVNWEKISTDFLNHIRTPKQCAKKWESIVRNKMRDDMKLAADLEQYQDTTDSKNRVRGLKSGIWTAADDDRLMEAVALFEGQGRGGAVDWGQVCDYVGNGRTYDQCRIRYNGVVKILKQKGSCVKSGAWEPAEDEKLIEAVTMHKGQGRGGGVHWNRVSEHFNGERTPNQCHSHWSSVLKPRQMLQSNNASWTEMEDIKLCEAVMLYLHHGKGGSVNWIKVQDHVGSSRSTYQLRMRWHSTLKNRVTETPDGEKRKSHAPPAWSEDEVERLVATVEACRLPPAPGEAAESITEAAVGGALVAHMVDWNTVSNAMTNTSLPGFNATEKRTPLQCVHKWREAINEMMTDAGMNTIDTNNSPWTEEEDQKFIEAVAVYNGHGRGGGIDWAKVCEYIGGHRRYNQCRHRWHNILKQRAMREISDPSGMDFRPVASSAPAAPAAWATTHTDPHAAVPVSSSVSHVGPVVGTQDAGQAALDAYANIQKYDI